MLDVLLDATWTDWLPIHVWLIEHDEGLILVDSGEVAHTPSTPVARFRVSANDEIAVQLQRRGFDPADVRLLVQTHLHGDHIGGLGAFPNAKVVCSRAEWQGLQGISGWMMQKIAGIRLPAGFVPEILQFTNVPYAAFPTSAVLTKDAQVLVVPTPGHTLGHVSVVVRLDNNVDVLIAGDAAYSQRGLLESEVSGFSVDAALEVSTYQRILQSAKIQPMIFLPSHDPMSAQRLEQRSVIPV